MVMPHGRHSAITVTYKVKLYSVENDVRTLVKEYPVTSATELDMSTELNNQGKYVYSVQALSDNTANCDNSAETFYTSTIDVSGILRSNLPDGSFAKTYDGTPITLSVEFSEPESYQWYCNGTAIPGATGPTYDVTYVRQNGIYSCQLGKGGSTYESTFRQVTISPKEVELTTTSGTWTYDATAHTKNVTAGENKDYSLTPVSSDAVTAITMPSSITNVGSVSNTVSGLVITHSGGEVVYRQADAALQNNTNNYLITYTYGTLTVAKSQVTITAGSTWKVYDGTPLSYNALSTVSHTALVQGHSLTAITVTGSRTTAGTCGNIPTDPVIEDGSGNDVTSNYDITLVVGTLTVTHRPITITGGSSSKEYDGTPLTFTGNHTAPGAYSITSGDLATRDTVDALTLTGSQTIVGSTANVPSALVIKNGDGTDVSASYDISYLNGTLSVTKTGQQISFASGSFEYDGNGHSITATVAASAGVTNGTPCGQITYYKVEADNSETLLGTSYSFTNAGTYTLRAKAAATNDYNAVTSSDITLTITRRPIKITAGSDSKVYDGTPLTKNSYSALYTGSAPGTNAALGSRDRFTTVTVTGSERDVNGSEADNNTITEVVIKNSAEENVNANYDITLVAGTLTVTPRPVVIEWTHDDLGTWSTAFATTYNNQDRTVTASSVSNKASVGDTADDVYVATYSSSGSNVNVARAVGNYTAVAASLAGSRSANYTLTGGTNISRTWSITGATREISVDTVEVTYDGLVHEVAPTQNGLEDPGTISVTYTPQSGSPALVGGKPVHAGTYNATVNIPATANYQSASRTVTVKINKRALTITSASDEKTYDGTALTKHELLIENGITKNESDYTVNATGDSLSLNFTGSLTNVTSGSSTTVNNTYNNVRILYTDGTTDVTTMDYIITMKYGSLRVNQRAITITAGTSSKVYNGTPLTFTGRHTVAGAYSISSGSLASGDSVDALTLTGSQTIVGSTSNVASGLVIKNSSAANVTASYDISYLSGTLTVTKTNQQISFTSGSFEYNGSGHSITATATPAAGVTNGTPCGQITYYKVEAGLETELGTSYSFTEVGTYTLRAKAAATNDYNAVTSSDITLTITRRPITITAGSDDKVYDGTPLTKNSYSALYAGSAPGSNAALGSRDRFTTVTVTGSETDVNGSETGNNAITTVVIKNAADENVNDNYDITLVAGTLTVTPKPVEIEWTHDNLESWPVGFETIYNNQDRTVTASNIRNKVTIEGVEDEVYVASYASSGTDLNVARNAGTYTAKVVSLAGSRSANYTLTGGTDVTKEWTIRKAVRNITVAPVTAIYDGQAHEVSPSQNGTDDPGTINVAYTPVGSSPALVSNRPVHAGVYNATVSIPATDNYQAAETTVTVTINKKPLTITSLQSMIFCLTE